MRIGREFGIIGAGLVCAAVSACGGAGPRAASATEGLCPTDGLSVGMLVGRQARVTVLATSAGTRYDLRSADGVLIGSGMTAAELAQRTGTDPRGAWAAGGADDEPMRLMLADPAPGRAGD